MAYRQDPANLGTVTQYDVLVGGASGVIGSVGPGSSRQVLQSGGASANPAYSTATYPATTISQQVLYSSSNNVVAGLTTNTNSVLVADGSGNISMNNTVTAWTPVLQFGGASVGITYNAQSGNWYKIGRVIFFDCYLDISSKGSSTGSATITGLTVPNNPALLGITNFTANNLTFSGQCNARIPSGTTTISLDQFASGGSRTQLSDTAFTAGTYIQLSGSYII